MLTAQEFRPKKILVPTDFSPSAVTAVRTAAEMAKFTSSELYVLHIVPMLPIIANPDIPFGFPNHEYLAEARTSANQQLALIAEQLKAEGIVCNVGLEIGNDVVGNIMMVADREHAGLLVISTHGVSGWRPIIFGSIAEKLIKLVECPLLLLRSPKDLPQP